MNDSRLFHLGVETAKYKGRAKYAILPGDPGRVDEIAAFLSNTELVAYNREFKSVLGFVGDIGVIVCSTGIGGPSAAIAVEELNMLGVKNFIRVGTCGGIDTPVKGGDTVVVTSTVRQEGTSLHYAPVEFPASADFYITKSLAEAAAEICSKENVHVGVTQCKDSFYGQHDPDRMPVSAELKEKWEAWKRLGVLSSEMESATIFCVAAALGCKAGTVLSVIWNQERANLGLPNGEIHDNQNAIKIAVEAIRKMG